MKGSLPSRYIALAYLTWDQSADTVIRQIREKKYPDSLKQYGGEILLVGISYDKRTKTHRCVIEKYTEN